MKKLLTTTALLLCAGSYGLGGDRPLKTQTVTRPGKVTTTRVAPAKTSVCHSGSCQHSHSSKPAVATTPTPRISTLPVRSSRIATTIPWQDDIRKAAIQAAREGRPLYVAVSAPWCHYCVKMKNETYTHPAVIKQINSDYVAVRVDADRDHELVRYLGIKSLPAVAIVSPDYKVQSMITGFKSAPQLTAKLTAIRPANPKQQKTKKTLRVEKIDPSVATVLGPVTTKLK